MKKSRILTGIMTIVMLACLTVPALAEGSTISAEGTNANVPVSLTTKMATFSVTIPTYLPIDVNEHGHVTTATDVKIVNNSAAAVKVKNLEIVAQNGWRTVSYDDTDMRQEPVGTMKVAMEINGAKTTGANLIDFAGGRFPTMKAVSVNNTSRQNEMSISYSAKVPAQINKLSSVNVANAVFTIGWDSV